jgi:hypothetical protein
MGFWFRVRVGPFGYTARGRRRRQSYRRYARSRERREGFAARYEREKFRRGTDLSVGDQLLIVTGIIIALLAAPFLLVGYLIRRFRRFLRGIWSSGPAPSDVRSDDPAQFDALEEDDEVLRPANELGDDGRRVKQRAQEYEKVIENGRVKYANPDYAGKSVSTLREWLRYWKGVAAGMQPLTPGSSDTAEMAPVEIEKLTAEIEARGYKA